MAVRSSEVPDDSPDEVKERAGAEPREPQTDPTLGIPVAVPSDATPPANRVVLIGDSLTQGFQSGAIYNTDLSYGAIVAYELGWLDRFRYPRYPGLGGLPLNLEFLLRDLEERFGPTFNLFEIPFATLRTRSLMNDIEEYWERGPGAVVPNIAGYNHALAVFSWDLYDALHKSFASCQAAAADPTDNLLIPMVDNAADRAALRVYPHVEPQDSAMTLFDVARTLDDDAGVQTLVVWLGANNVLGSVVRLKLAWSQDPGYQDPAVKGDYTVWQPQHFRNQYDDVIAQVERIPARNVILCTVPHVTIPPIAHGVYEKPPGSRYFRFYARPWVTDAEFDPNHDKHLTGPQARAIDYAIDLYNDYIERRVAQQRRQGRNWYLFDVAGVLDRLAYRRYIDDPSAQPSWWTPYPLPPALADLDPVPDTRFLTADGHGGRATGGLFSLDGIHPTTVAYGIVAQELISIMQLAGVQFYSPNGTPRTGRISVDFDRLIRRDTLLTSPPQNINSTMDVLGWLDETVDVFAQLLRGRL